MIRLAAFRASLVIGALAVLATSPAMAAPTAEESAIAAELFKQGRELMATGKAEEACPKLAESHRLDPGGGTVLNLGLCYEAAGRLASAYGALNEALALARRDDRDDRIEIASERLANIEPRLSRLVLQVPAAADVPGLRVERNGAEVARAAWGSAMPVDGGRHEIVASAPGRTSWSTTIQVGTEKDTQTLSLPLLEPEAAPTPPPPTPPPAPLAKPATSPREAPEHDSTPGASQRWAGFIVGGVGVLGLGAGTYFGLRAVSKRDESEALCKGGCTLRGSELSREAATNADLSTASFAIAAVGLGLGTYLVLSAPSDEGGRVGLTLGPGSASVRGRF